MLGCFVPLHKCIDNAIHSAAGMELREECSRIMSEQGHDEPTGRAKITHGYNLPAKWVLHTMNCPLKVICLTFRGRFMNFDTHSS